MARDRRLEEAFRPLAEALVTDTDAQYSRAIRGALNPDGTVRTDALTAALPWQRIDFRIPDAATVGTGAGGIYELPQGGTVRRISARTRVAPSAGAFTFRLVINGEATDFAASIQQGVTSIAGGASIVVPAGGVVTLSITSGGGAEDITVSCFYTGGPL